MPRRITLLLLAASLCSASPGHAQAPRVLASYPFEGSAADVSGSSPAMTLTNAPLVDGALFLNGIPGLGNTNGYVALAPVPELAYGSFAFRVECNPTSLAQPFVNLICGGPAQRWMVLSVEFGVLSLRLNLVGANWLFQFPEATLVTNQWNQIIVSLDAAAGRVTLYLNGARLRELRLSPGFQFAVTGTTNEQPEKVFNFNNYGNSTAFHGFMDNFKVYHRALSEAEIQQLLFPRLNLSKAGDSVMASWPGDLTGYRLQASPGSWPANSWATLPELPQVTNALQAILLSPAQSRQFFRLVRP